MNYFELLYKRMQREFPEGMMFHYCDIEFYVKYYSACDEMFCDFAEDPNSKMWIICEYFDSKDNKFKEKSFFENFLRTRMKVLMQNIEG